MEIYEKGVQITIPSFIIYISLKSVEFPYNPSFSNSKKP